MKHLCSNQTSKWITTACFALFAIQSIGAEFVEITAELESIGWSGSATDSPADAKPKTVSLVCTVGAHEWRIDNPSENAEEKWSFDGTNVYNSIRVTRPLSEERQERISKTTGLPLVPFERAKSNVTIRIWPSRDGHPLADSGVNIAWLAFCSGTYLKRENRLIPVPVATLRHTRDRFGYTDKTVTFNDGFGLPRTVDLFTSRSLLEVSEDDFDNEHFFGDRYADWKKKIVANLEEGVRIFHYEVTESTNFFGWNLPTKFEFFQNARAWEQNGDWFCRGKGRVTSIRAAAKPQSLFLSNMQQTIVDWRFRDPAAHVDGLTYTWTNAFVAPTNDPALQQKFRARAERVGPGKGK